MQYLKHTASKKKGKYTQSPKLKCATCPVDTAANKFEISRLELSLYFKPASAVGSNPRKKVNSANKQSNFPLRGELILFNLLFFITLFSPLST